MKAKMKRITLSDADLEAIRTALLFKMKRTPERFKGGPGWLSFNTAYDNLIDAINDADELRPLAVDEDEFRKQLQEAEKLYRGRRTMFDPKGKN